MVADFHTYFVGCEEWGFAVWAHNKSVYRGVETYDLTSMAAGNGISATQPGAGNSIESHISGGRKFRSQWISATKSEAIARARYGKNGVVAIDLDKVTSQVVDCSAGIPGCTDPTTNGYAILDQEVVIKDNIPQAAITLLP